MGFDMAMGRPSVKLPGPDDVTRHVLPNGLTVLVRENWTNPAVVIRGLLRVGSAQESVEQTGLSAFTALLLTRGTQQRSFYEIAESIESVGASLGFGSNVYSTGFGGKCLHEDLPMLLGILADALAAPTFPTAQVDRVRGQILEGIRQRESSTSAMAHQSFWSLLYPTEHPYARPLSGNRDTVTHLSQADLARFYTDHYTPKNGILVIVGAVHTAEVLRLVEQTVGGWAGATNRNGDHSAAQFDAIVPPLGEVKRQTIALAGKSQSDFVLGMHSLARHHPDYLALSMLNSILGQIGIGGRLGNSVREEEGLAYYVGSTLVAGLSAGPWYAHAGVNPRNVDRAIDLILTELRRIRETPIDADELADVKAFLIGSLPIDVETNGGVAGELLTMELFGLGLDYLYRFPELVTAITIDDVQAVARRWLTPEAYVLSVAGPGEKDD